MSTGTPSDCLIRTCSRLCHEAVSVCVSLRVCSVCLLFCVSACVTVSVCDCLCVCDRVRVCIVFLSVIAITLKTAQQIPVMDGQQVGATSASG
jgi:hypothetical protein